MYRPRAHISTLIVLLLFLPLACTACSPKPHGSHGLDELNGIAIRSGLFYNVSIEMSDDELPWDQSLDITATLTPRASVSEKITAAVDYLLRLAWSETIHNPTFGGVYVRVEKADGTLVDPTALRRDLLNGTKLSRYDWDSVMSALYGSWPGPVPQVPENLAGISDTHCDTKAPGPYGTYTCKQIIQIATAALGKGIDLRAAFDNVTEQENLIINTRWGAVQNLDYPLRLAWAQTSVKPTGSIIVFFYPANYRDLYAADPDLPCGKATLVGISGLFFDHNCLEQLYGPWPGPVPEAPLDVSPTTSPTTEPSPSPS